MSDITHRPGDISCVGCGQPIERKKKWGYEYYATRKYCSQDCRRKPPPPPRKLLPHPLTRMTEPVGRTLEDIACLVPHIREKIETTDSCWLWRGIIDTKGYGMVFYARHGKQKTWRAHRAVYEVIVGPIPEGLHLDHLCRVRECVNPDHLEPVANYENIIRGTNKGIRAWVEDVCIRGHDLTDESNIYRPPGKPRERHCRQCQRFFVAKYQARKRAEANSEAVA